MAPLINTYRTHENERMTVKFAFTRDFQHLSGTYSRRSWGTNAPGEANDLSEDINIFEVAPLTYVG
jgi:hypothetical protein